MLRIPALSVAIVAACLLSACDETVSGPPELRPECDNPAPLAGPRPPNVIGYFIMLRDGVDTSDEVGRLEVKYNFIASHIWPSFETFAVASLSQEAIVGLQCEGTVQLLEYSRLGRLDG